MRQRPGDVLPHGDAREVGEDGVGQRFEIGLAAGHHADQGVFHAAESAGHRLFGLPGRVGGRLDVVVEAAPGAGGPFAAEFGLCNRRGFGGFGVGAQGGADACDLFGVVLQAAILAEREQVALERQRDFPLSGQAARFGGCFADQPSLESELADPLLPDKIAPGDQVVGRLAGNDFFFAKLPEFLVPRLGVLVLRASGDRQIKTGHAAFKHGARRLFFDAAFVGSFFPYLVDLGGQGFIRLLVLRVAGVEAAGLVKRGGGFGGDFAHLDADLGGAGGA